MIRHRAKILLAVALAAATPLAAQGQVPPGPMSPAMAGMEQAAPPCPAPAPPPPELAAWLTPHRPVLAARGLADAPGALLEIGEPVDATLPHTPLVNYPVSPARPGGAATYGGILAFDVAHGGHYRVVLNGHAWTDVIEAGAEVDSIAHARAPACTGMAKMVEFALKPGRHLLQISGQAEPGIAIMITRVP